MTMAPPVLGWAMLAYAVSFGLFAVSRGGAPIPGYFCAYGTLVNTLVMDSRLFEGKRAEYIALLISGWINIAFLASLAIRWRSGNGRAFRILGTTTLLMIPFCWIGVSIRAKDTSSGSWGWCSRSFQKARLRAVR